MIDSNLETLADRAFKNGELYTAEQMYIKILASNPNNVNALYNLAYINVAKLDYEKAEILLDNALKLSANIKILRLLAYVKEKRYKLYDAIVMYEQLLELEPSESLFEVVGDLYIQLELYDNAVNITKDYVNKFPTIMAYRRLFLLYLNLGKIKELSILKDEIQSKFPNKGLAFNLLGMYTEYIEGNIVEAEKLYEKSAKLGVTIAVYDLAQCYKKQKKYLEAEKSCKKILNTYPRKNDVLNLLKDINFAEKKFRKGYKYYLERNLNDEFKFTDNKWDGKDYPDKKLLIISDNDNIEFIRHLRYLNSVKKKFRDVIISCISEQEEFLTYNKIKFINASQIKKEDYDYFVLLSELPYYLNSNFENIPQLTLKSDKIDLNSDKFKIGILWKSTGDSMKAINISSVDVTKYFNNLFELDNIDFYSFQKNDVFNVLSKYPQINDLSSKLNSIMDYANYVNSMDLIISIDSEVLHLGGILGKKTLALIPYDAQWYWFDDENKTDWYKSVELYRQHIGEDWTDVSKKVVEKVKVLAKK